jgi:pimeloyl-ACP methyl ester carboxylesterase
VDGGWTWRTDARLRITSSLRLTDDQVKGFVGRITAPTLLVLGNEGLGGDGRFDHRIEWLRDVRVTRLPGRHHLHMDDPLPVADAIKAFLG